MNSPFRALLTGLLVLAPVLQPSLDAQKVQGASDTVGNARLWDPFPFTTLAVYKQIQQIYMKAAPIVFLYQSPYPVALRKSVKGFVQIPLGNNIFSGAYIEK